MQHLLVDDIELIVREIEDEFQKSKGLILTEDDLKCHLFRKLHDIIKNHSEFTLDNDIKASPLHTEIKYFDENDELLIRPDINIINTSLLSVLHSVNYEINGKGIAFKQLTPTGKQFEFAGNSIVFELKFCRNRNGINRRHIESYKKDIEKIRKLQAISNLKNREPNLITGYVIIFNKTDIRNGEFHELYKLEDDYLKIFYATGNVEFPTRSEA